MKVEFQIFRQLPPNPPQIQSFYLEASTGSTLLDCLTRIKWEQDGSLAFRKNCRNTICGSCAMRVNGRAVLACKQHVEEELQPGNRIVVAPLGNLPVLKDLVVNMDPFWDGLQQVKPYVQAAKPANPVTQESLQSPQERSILNAASNCILCGACYSDCNAKEVSPDFVGPHALAKANRLIQDSRDQDRVNRLEQYNSQTGVWGCTRCLNCNMVCPMEVGPLDQITHIKQTLLATINPPTHPAIRHRKSLVDQVRQDGWIDERRFSLSVMGRELQGVLRLMALGLRLLARGKFPIMFYPSEGVSSIDQLIRAVRREPRSKQP